MPVPKVAIDKYLARQLSSLAWAKELKPLEVEEELSYIKPTPHFHCPLRVDQKILFLVGLAYPETVFMSDLGSGKTAVSLELLSYFYDYGFLRRGFVFTPTDEVAEGWEDEINRWNFDIPFVRLTGSSQDKWEQLQTLKSGIAIGTYIGIAAMVSKLVPIEGKNKQKRQIVPRLALGITQNVDAVVFDQCFPEYTQITTSNGLMPISAINQGDLVLSSDLQYRPVKKVLHKKSSILSKIYLSNGQMLYVTPDHPFFTDTGWVCAGNLIGRTLYDQSDLQELWGNVPQKAFSSSKTPSWEMGTSTILQCILLEELDRLYHIQRTTFKNDDLMESRSAELEQRAPSSRRSEKKTKRSPFKIRPYLQIPRRQRDRLIVTSATFADRIKPAMDSRVSHFIAPEAARLSNMLQSRLWQSSSANCDRDRRQFTPQHKPESKGQEKGRKATRIRVDRVETIKYSSPQDVYTITVEGCPNFFANGLLVHNSTKLGNTESLSYQVCRDFSLEAQLRFALAGRAFGRDPFVLFTQFFLTDHGKALGRSPGMFREVFWRRTQSPWGVNWVFRKRREKELSRFIAASSIRYSIDECVQIPPKVYVKKECSFPDENWVYYDRIREELIAAQGNYREVKNSFLRMRQISSGFVGFKDDETGEKAQIEFEANPKLDLLMELVSEVPDDRKMVIVYEFTWMGARICQELSKAKLKHGWLWAGTKDWTKIKEAYNHDPDFRIIVMNWKKGAMGLNLQAGSYMFIAESPVSGIERYELEGRIYRTGQLHKSMIYDLVVKDSVDQKILDFHKESKDIFRALVENPAKYLGRSKRG